MTSPIRWRDVPCPGARLGRRDERHAGRRASLARPTGSSAHRGAALRWYVNDHGAPLTEYVKMLAVQAKTVARRACRFGGPIWPHSSSWSAGCTGAASSQRKTGPASPASASSRIRPRSTTCWPWGTVSRGRCRPGIRHRGATPIDIALALAHELLLFTSLRCGNLPPRRRRPERLDCFGGAGGGLPSILDRLRANGGRGPSGNARRMGRALPRASRVAEDEGPVTVAPVWGITALGSDHIYHLGGPTHANHEPRGSSCHRATLSSC